MRGFSYRWVLLFVGLSFGFSGSASATYYYYNTQAQAGQACQADLQTGNYANPRCDVVSTPMYYKLINFANAQTYHRYYWTGCPSGQISLGGGLCGPAEQECEQNWSGGEKVWSVSQQECVKYPNLPAAEYCSWAAGRGTRVQETVNSNSANGPSQAVQNATFCVANVDSAQCTSRVNTDGDGSYTCAIDATMTGEYNPNASNTPDGYCPTGDCEEPPEVPDVPTPTPTEYNDTDPCIYASNGSGGLTCTSSTKNEKEGTSNCGTVNGVWQCINKAPTNNGIVIVSDVNSTTNGDGTTTTTKTDKATVTSCAGIGLCTSKTTTTTTTTTKDGNGNTTSVSGSCTGEQCPDKNTNPDGDGDGFGDCVGDDCGGGGGAGVESPELEETPGYGDSLGTYWDEIRGAPIVAAVTAISLPAGGNCPVYTETIEYIGTVSTATACDLASGLLTPLHYLFLAIWAFVAVRTTMTA